jgi:acetylcholinesterase
MKIGGQSAGAHSVGAHLQHFWKQDDRRPFTQAILNSGGPTARMWSDWTYPMYEKQFRRFLEKTGCHRGEDEKATFDCLRSPSLEPNTIRTARYGLNYNASERERENT